MVPPHRSLPARRSPDGPGGTAGTPFREGGGRSGRTSTGILLAVFAGSLTALLLASGSLERWWQRWNDVSQSAVSDGDPAAESDATGGPRIPGEPAAVPHAVTTQAAAPRRDLLPDPGQLNDEAVAAIEEGDLDRAIRLLAEAVTARPEHPTFRANLGEAFLRRARARQAEDAVAALADFEFALQYTDDQDQKRKVATLRDKARAIVETEAEFVVEPTLHFTFKFDGTRDEILDGVEELKVLLESTYQDYGDLFRHRPVEAGEPRIEVVLYRAEGFDRVTGLGDWAGGVFDGTIRVPADDLTDLRRVTRVKDVLRHEVAHAFTQSIGGTGVPAWLNEGIAQWLENPARRHESVKFARARLAAAQGQGTPLFELSKLTGSLVAWSDKSEVSRAYDQALAFTDYLMQHYGSDLVFEMAGACKDGGAAGATALFRQRILVELDVVLADFGDTLE